MKSKYLAVVPVVFVSASMLSQAATAEAFVAASVGSSQWRDIECGNTSSCDRRDTGGTLRAGWRYTPWFGVEARYFDLGKSRSTFSAGTVLVPDVGNVVGHSEFSAKGLGIDAVFTWPVADRVSLSAMAGVARGEAKAKFDFDDPIGSPVRTIGVESTQRKTEPYYGVGAAFSVTPQVAISLEAERYRIGFAGTTSVDLFSAGLVYRFR